VTGVQTGSLPVGAGELYFERAGEGFPVVLVHGALWDRRIWDPQMEPFAAQHDVIRYDRRGHGRSGPPAGPYSELADLRAVLDALGIARCAVVGCSSGAQIAIDIALAHPEVVDAIVAVAPLVSGRAWSDPGIEVLAGELRAAVDAGDLRRAVETELAVWAPLTTDPGADALIRGVALENASAYAIDTSLVDEPPPAVDRLGEMQAATLIVVGDNDVEEVHTISDLLADRIPGAQKRVIAGADQPVNVRRPAKFNKMVLDFLSFRM
jgi:pimeloyl-ACP methyl ester carboxylesterase